jgi:hypothetical protein
MLSFDVKVSQMAVSITTTGDRNGTGMTLTNADRMAEARQLVERALALAVEADETLAAAELEQALDTLSRYGPSVDVSSGVSSNHAFAIR